MRCSSAPMPPREAGSSSPTGTSCSHPDALRQAIAYANTHQLDHLTVGPEAPVPGLLLQAAVAGFGVFFSVFTRAWKVRDPRSSAHIGVGAFNLVRRAAYLRAGGHTTLRLRPDDDLKLGSA
jgi:hypothetical protein